MDSRLTIYAQSTGNNMGELIANGLNCGIGSSEGSIRIDGGKITATSSSDSGWGISERGEGSVSINGGEVTAIGNGVAINGSVKNVIAGTGWTDTAGTAGEAAEFAGEEGRPGDRTCKGVHTAEEQAG